MIFKRRERPPTYIRLREALAPRKGWWRGLDYINKRLQRLPDSPHRIALGFACGAFVSFTPFFGVHILMAVALAWALRGNLLSALFGTAIANPLTFPLIATTSIGLGRSILGHDVGVDDFHAVTHAFAEAMDAIWGTVQSWFGYGPSMLHGLSVFLHEVFLPYLIGGILPGLLVAGICYWIIGPVVAAYQSRRRKKLMAIQAQQRARLDDELAGRNGGVADG